MRKEYHIHKRVFHICILITLFLAFSCKTSQKAGGRKKDTVAQTESEPEKKPQIITRGGTPDSLGIDSNQVAMTDSTKAGKDSLSIPPQKKFLDNPVDYNAEDSIILDARKRKIYLYKNAEVTYGTINLKAHYIEIDMKTKTLHAESELDSLGNIVKKADFRDADKQFSARTIDYNFDTKKGLVTDVITQESEAFLHGERVKYSKEYYKGDTVDVIYTYKGRITTCNLAEPHFHIASNKIKVIPKKRVVTGPAVFCVDGVPTPAILPFGFFPNQENRASGLILPKFVNLQSRGFGLDKLGYYWAISPKVDAAFYGTVYMNGSWGAGITTNYNQLYKVNGSVSFNYFEAANGNDRKDTANFFISREFSFKWKHVQDPKSIPGQNFSADVNIVTNGFNQNSTLDINNYVQSGFQSNINYGFVIPRTPFNVAIALSHSQNTQSRIFDMTLPQVTLNTNRFFPFKPKNRKRPVRWINQLYEGIGINHQSIIGARIATQDTLLRREWDNGFRNSFKWGARHQMSVSNSFKIAKYISVTPAFNYYEYWNSMKFNPVFNQLTQQFDRDTTRGFYRSGEWDLRADVNTNIFAFFRFKSEKVKAIRYLATPTVGFTYNPDFNTNIYGFFGPNGAFSTFDPYLQAVYGMAKRGRQGSITFSLNNNLEAKVRAPKDTITGEKKIKLIEAFSISGSYNFLADSLRLQPFVFSFRTSYLDNKLDVVIGAVLDPYAYGSDIYGNNYRINTLQYKADKRIGRLTSARVSLSYVLVGKRREDPAINPNTTTPAEIQYYQQNRNMYLDFTIPYNLSINYNLNISNAFDSATVSNALGIRGDFSLTPNWKIDFQSGFDFRTLKITPTEIGISRNLHCWQMDLSWIPIGPLSSVLFTIRAKPGLLQDLKANVRRGSYYPIGN